ncbi:MAG TPA: GNAT family N-acetyltransferase [Acidimicrobiales bacterium]
MTGVERWGRYRTPDVLALVAAALPGEALTDDDVVASVFDDPDPTVVVGTPDATGFASAVARTDAAGRVTAHLQLLAVDPGARRAGIGRALVESVHRWAFDERRASAVVTGANAPFYLFAGVDVHATAALCLFEAMGYRPVGANLNLAFSSRFRAPVPAGVVLRRVLEEADAAAVVAFCERHWPNWVPELRRGIEHGACHAAFAEDGLAAGPASAGPAPAGPASAGLSPAGLSPAGPVAVGFGCHSVNRLAWLGPIATDPARQHGGVGGALLGAIATDVMAAGFDTVEVSWIGPIGFYAKTAGATVSRVFRVSAFTPPA